MRQSTLTQPPQIRDAASVIVLRNASYAPSVLMGQRNAKAAFMPKKFVFPGGAVDPEDAYVALADPLAALCARRLAEGTPQQGLASALAAAAIRELWEETGQILGRPGAWHDAPHTWRTYAATGNVPSAAPLQFVFRAITPPGRPRRFDARFFLLDADALSSDPDDFSAASSELADLQWITLDEVRRFDLPFITQVVLAEVAARAANADTSAPVPFFRNSDGESQFLKLHGNPVPKTE